MANHLVIDNEIVGDIATIQDWGDFIDWADSLDLNAYYEVVHLAEHGWSPSLAKLESQLGMALRNEESKPTKKNVAKVGRLLLKYLSETAWGPESSIIVSDGEGGPDEPEPGAEPEVGS